LTDLVNVSKTKELDINSTGTQVLKSDIQDNINFEFEQLCVLSTVLAFTTILQNFQQSI